MYIQALGARPSASVGSVDEGGASLEKASRRSNQIKSIETACLNIVLQR
jgi:hypothetical protein